MEEEGPWGTTAADMKYQGRRGGAQAVARTMRLRHNESNSSCLVFD